MLKKINYDEILIYKQTILKLLEQNCLINMKVDNVNEYVKSKMKDLLLFSQNDSALFYGAFHDVELIGILWAYKLTDSVFHLSHLVIDEKFRNQGVGRELLKMLEANLPSGNIIELWTTASNISAIKFYKRMGFEVARLKMEKKVDDKD